MQRNDNADWPSLAEGLYTFLTGRGATIEYAFENMEILIPRDTSENSPRARWNLNGRLKIRTTEQADG